MNEVAAHRESTLLSAQDVCQLRSRSSSVEWASRLTERDLWEDAVDTLLGWRRDPDLVSSPILESAIDLAIDLRELENSPPSSITATDDGEITFEWRTRREIHMICIQGAGLAEYTRFRDGHVIEETVMRRDPRTRRLQALTQ